MHDRAQIGRRGLLAGVAAGAALGAGPALAQFPNLGGLAGGDIGRLVGQVSDVLSNMNFTEADEIALGEGYYDRFIDQSGGLYNSRSEQEALRDFAQPVIATTRRTGLPWEIALIDNDTVNAWALPGGKIGVHKGLIRYVATPEELAAVISHEVGHAELSHGAAQIKNKKFTQGMSNIAKQRVVERVSRSKAGALGGLITNELLTALEGPIFDMITGGYSQDLEYAADSHIVGVFHAMGYDTGRATDFYNTMLRLMPPGAKATTSLYATHPGTRDRIKRLQLAIAKDKSPIAANVGHAGWAGLKSSFPTRSRFRLA
ncbi:MAG TPA: M48 family metallopeptidase [Phenylobacterium sp.]|nr:M48 family metallopeptidase [Phenylobacterium sp.]